MLLYQPTDNFESVISNSNRAWQPAESILLASCWPSCILPHKMRVLINILVEGNGPCYLEVSCDANHISLARFSAWKEKQDGAVKTWVWLDNQPYYSCGRECNHTLTTTILKYLIADAPVRSFRFGLYFGTPPATQNKIWSTAKEDAKKFRFPK